ncbi:MAG: hypothetical protein J1F14_06725 [Treponema sp.]|nr:hypothetical protein [Treponema sp.]
MKSHSFYVRVMTAVFAVLLYYPALSQSVPRSVTPGEEDWRFLEMAENAMEAGNYGGAVEYAEKARAARKQRCQWEIYTLERSLRLSSVRREADSLQDVIPVMEKNGLSSAAEIVRVHLDLRGADFYRNSLSGILEFENHLMLYPEVDYLIGRVYRMEGEYELSRQYLISAYEASDILEVPAQKYDILYDLADLYLDSGDSENFEKYMLLVMSDNEDYVSARFMRAIIHIVEEDKAGSVEKYFMLYRSGYTDTLRAMLSLAEFYSRSGETGRALRCSALGCTTALTKIEAALDDRINGYAYTSLADLLSRSADFEDIVEWGNANGIWRLFYIFADNAADAGNIRFASELFRILSEHEPEPYWRRMAEQRLIR